jgi:hypothetical protein
MGSTVGTVATGISKAEDDGVGDSVTGGDARGSSCGSVGISNALVERVFFFGP